MSFARRVTRQRERLAELNGTPVRGADWQGCVAILLENEEALRVRRDALGHTLLFMVGGALPIESIEEVDAILARGAIPVVSVIDGMVEVSSGRLVPLGIGGDA